VATNLADDILQKELRIAEIMREIKELLGEQAMSKEVRKNELVLAQPRLAGYDAMLGQVVHLLESARRASARAVNALLTATYWDIGRRIVEFEQRGKGQADYGSVLIMRLAGDLTERFGRGFGKSNLYQMRGFYLAFREIFQTLSGKSETATKHRSPPISQTLSGKSPPSVEAIAHRFPLTWSHYVLLLKVEKHDARAFYEAEALRNGWTVRQLDRQVSTLFYERTLASRNKAAMLTKGALATQGDTRSPEAEIKDPFVLEFLGLKDEYSESDLEEALIQQLEAFLLELGGDFAFIGRQRRLRIGDEWYRIDLLFFHRKLRCLVVIDLKLGKFTHADAGQMHLYLNYAREHWTHSNENPPVGLILCTHKDQAVAHYSLDGLPNKVLAAEYRLALPNEQLLAAELERSRRLIEDRRARTRRAKP
jgi:predicted nuclease of restriction endonuclease-like (RecB) superfamily